MCMLEFSALQGINLTSHPRDVDLASRRSLCSANFCSNAAYRGGPVALQAVHDWKVHDAKPVDVHTSVSALQLVNSECT